MLAVDYALKPVLSALKAQEILQGVFADDSQIILNDQQATLAPPVEARFVESLQSFTRALGRNIHPGVRHYSVVT